MRGRGRFALAAAAALPLLLPSPSSPTLLLQPLTLAAAAAQAEEEEGRPTSHRRHRPEEKEREDQSTLRQQLLLRRSLGRWGKKRGGWGGGGGGGGGDSGDDSSDGGDDSSDGGDSDGGSSPGWGGHNSAWGDSGGDSDGSGNSDSDGSGSSWGGSGWGVSGSGSGSGDLRAKVRAHMHSRRRCTETSHCGFFTGYCGDEACVCHDGDSDSDSDSSNEEDDDRSRWLLLSSLALDAAEEEGGGGEGMEWQWEYEEYEDEDEVAAEGEGGGQRQLGRKRGKYDKKRFRKGRCQTGEEMVLCDVMPCTGMMAVCGDDGYCTTRDPDDAVSLEVATTTTTAATTTEEDVGGRGGPDLVPPPPPMTTKAMTTDAATTDAVTTESVTTQAETTYADPIIDLVTVGTETTYYDDHGAATTPEEAYTTESTTTESSATAAEEPGGPPPCCESPEDCYTTKSSDECGNVSCDASSKVCVYEAYNDKGACAESHFVECGGDDSECTKGPDRASIFEGTCTGYGSNECVYTYCPTGDGGDGDGMAGQQGTTTPTTTEGAAGGPPNLVVGPGGGGPNGGPSLVGPPPPPPETGTTTTEAASTMMMTTDVEPEPEPEPEPDVAIDVMPMIMPMWPMWGIWYQNSPDDFVPYQIPPINDDVAEGYKSCDDLREGLRQAASYLVNEQIKNNARWIPDVVTEKDVTVMDAPMMMDTVAMPAMTMVADSQPMASIAAPAEASRVDNLDDSYGTNNQEEEVDEGDAIKVAEGGTIIAAAYGSSLYMIDADAMEVLSQLTYEYDSEADSVSEARVDPAEATRKDDFTDVPDAGGGGKPPPMPVRPMPVIPEPMPVPIVVEPMPEISLEEEIQEPPPETAEEPQEPQKLLLRGRNRKNRERKLRDLLSIAVGPGYPYYSGPTQPSIRALLLERTRLVVVLAVYSTRYTYNDPEQTVLSESPYTQVRIYDISDVDSAAPPVLVGVRDIAGSYTAARSIGTIGHVVTSSSLDTTFHLTGYFDRWRPEFVNMDKSTYISTAQSLYPEILDSFLDRLMYELASDPGGSCEDIVKISTFQTGDGDGGQAQDAAAAGNERADLLRNLVRIVSFDIAQNPTAPDATAEVAQLEAERAGVFTPWGESYVYSSKDIMVVPANGRRYDPMLDRYRDSTLLWAFALSSDASEAAKCLGVAKVRGTTTLPGSLDQFSFDAYDGVLRVATTDREQWGCREYEGGGKEGRCLDWGILTNSTSQITVLELPDTTDGGAGGVVMEEIALIEDLGVTEQIFAVRFMDTKAFVVTFRRTDPFYSIDFSDPRDPNPPIGELANITGFSNYLHPFDADGNVILAVGEEADRTGRAMGLQISLFDVTDLRNPKLMHKYHEGKGAYSNAQSDHKAFRFVRRNDGSDGGVLILPVRMYNYTDPAGNFDGFRLYDVTLANGVEELFDVSHASSHDIAYGCWGARGSLPPRSFLVGGGTKLVTSKRHSFVKTDMLTEDTDWVLTMASSVKHSCFYDW